MKHYSVAESAFRGADLAKPETLKGLGIWLGDVAPLILAAQRVVMEMDKARGRKQKVEPTGVRLSIGMLRAVLNEHSWSVAIPEAENGDSVP